MKWNKEIIKNHIIYNYDFLLSLYIYFILYYDILIFNDIYIII